MRPAIYLEQKSIIHRLDPRTKVALIASTATTSILLDSPLLLGVLWLITALLLLLSKNIRTLIFLTVMLAYLWGFTAGLLFLIGANGEASLHSLKFFLKAGAIVNTGLLLAFTTPTNILFNSLEKLKMPRPIILMLILTYRFIPIFMQAAMDALDSLRMRGVSLKVGSFIREPGLFSRGIAIPLTMSMVRSSRDLAAALEARAYGNPGKRTSFKEVKFCAADWLFISGFLAFPCALLILGWLSYL